MVCGPDPSPQLTVRVNRSAGPGSETLPVSVTVPPSATAGVTATLDNVGATLRTRTSVVNGADRVPRRGSLVIIGREQFADGDRKQGKPRAGAALADRGGNQCGESRGIAPIVGASLFCHKNCVGQTGPPFVGQENGPSGRLW